MNAYSRVKRQTFLAIDADAEMTATVYLPAQVIALQGLAHDCSHRATEYRRAKAISSISRGVTAHGWNTILVRRVIQLHVTPLWKTMLGLVHRSHDKEYVEVLAPSHALRALEVVVFVGENSGKTVTDTVISPHRP